MANSVTLDGGCLCGELRYRISVEPTDAGYCHCRLCQHSSAAPALAWCSVPVKGFSYKKGNPTLYASSPHADREFCNLCGTQVAFRKHGAEQVDVNFVTLDDPEAIKPQYHIWTSSRISWFDTADDLTRYEDDGPETASST